MKLLVLAAAIAGACVGIGVAVAQHSTANVTALHAQATWNDKPAPAFALPDERGHTVSLASLRGRTVLLTFLDSRCHSQCPIEGAMLAQIERRVHVPLVVVSANPWGDAAWSVNAFVQKERWSFDWHWLLGTPAQLRPVWRSYSVAVKRTPNDVLHTLALYVIDKHGDQRAAYLFPFVPTQVAADIRNLA
jgi:cytochrome oxidase Cu insertion factor (SCO1/SenC/PrrC family)